MVGKYLSVILLFAILCFANDAHTLPEKGSETMIFMGIETWGGDSESYLFKRSNGEEVSFSVQWNRAVVGVEAFRGGPEKESPSGYSMIYGKNIGANVVVTWSTQTEMNMGGETVTILALEKMELASAALGGSLD